MGSIVGSSCPALGQGLTYLKGEALPIGQPSQDGRRRVYVVEFWTTWCPPCRASIPHLSELQRKYAAKDVYIVGVTTEKDVAKLRPFVDKAGMDYTVAADVSGAAEAQLYLKSDARGIPHAFVVDADNKITYSGHPMEPAFERALSAAASKATDRQQKQALKALPPVTDSREQLMQRGVKELRAILQERGIPSADCLEKGDLVDRIVERCSKATHYVQAPAGA